MKVKGRKIERKNRSSPPTILKNLGPIPEKVRKNIRGRMRRIRTLERHICITEPMCRRHPIHISYI